MSRTVKVVKACQPHFTQTSYNYKTPELFWQEYSLSLIFTDLILHNYRSNQSALMTRFGTDLHHQCAIFGGKSQTQSFTRNATRAGCEEGRLFSQASFSLKPTFPTSNSTLESSGILNEFLWTPGAPWVNKLQFFLFYSSNMLKLQKQHFSFHTLIIFFSSQRYVTNNIIWSYW